MCKPTTVVLKIISGKSGTRLVLNFNFGTRLGCSSIKISLSKIIHQYAGYSIIVSFRKINKVSDQVCVFKIFIRFKFQALIVWTIVKNNILNIPMDYGENQKRLPQSSNKNQFVIKKTSFLQNSCLFICNRKCIDTRHFKTNTILASLRI